MNRNKTLLDAIIAIAIVSFTRTTHATPINETSRHSIDGGGIMRSSSGNIEMSATIGQLDAGVLSGGGIELTGGFWFRVSPMDCDENGSVGFGDYQRFLDCVTGPVPPVLEDCRCCDANASNTVDLLDWGIFQREFNDASPPPRDSSFTTVTGEVHLLSLDGDAVAGATVELIGHDRSMLTGQGGVFVFDDVPTVPPIVNVVATATISGEELFGGARFVKPFRGGTTDVGVIVLSNIVRWVSPTDGLWINDPNWEAFFPPKPSHSVVIDVPDADITVTHDQTVPFDGPLGDLLCNEKLRLDTFSTLSVAGSFQMNNTLEMKFSTLVDSTVDLGPGGLIDILRIGAATLDGVTVNGNLDIVDGNLAALRILNGVTVNGAVRMTGLAFSTSGARMFFEGPNKFIDGDATISFLSNAGITKIHQNDGGNLHIRSGVTIRGARGEIGIASAPLVQDGLIHSDTSGIIDIRGLDWVNNGHVRVSSGGSELAMRGSWTNHGAIEATDAGRIILDGTYQNLGTFTATDADVRLDGEFTIADLGTFDFTNSPAVIEGTFVNESGLVLDADQFNWKLGNGTVLGGTISSADGMSFDRVRGIGGGNATLDGVTLDADMSISGTGGSVTIRNGLTLNGRIGLFTSDSASALIRVDGPTRTIDGTGQIEFLSTSFGAGSTGIRQGNLGTGDPGLLTIGPGITVFGTSGIVGADGGPFSASLVNNGTIHSDRPGTITVKGSDWVNNGTVTSSGGGTIMTRDAWTNNGTFRIGPGPSLESAADYAQTSTGTFVSELRSTAVDGYGKMIVDGTAALDGALRIEFENTYAPAAGDSFAILQYGNHVGEFASVEVIGLDPGFAVVPTYGNTFLDITVQQN